MKSYRQFCGVARALDAVGERWTLLIVRDLLLGPRRYTDLERGLGAIAPAVLSQRLDHLERLGFIERRLEKSYALTPTGRELEPVVLALGAFGARYLDEPRPDDRLDPRWAMLSLKRRFRGARGRETVTLRVGAQAFTASFVQSTIDVKDGASDGTEASVDGDSAAWLALLSRRTPLDDLVAAETIRIHGQEGVALALLRGLGVR